MQKITIRDFLKKKGKEKITMLTVYDYSMAKVLSETNIDGVLVGDSLGMNVLGFPSTLQVDMEHMIHHTRAVSRASVRQLLVVDMPFMSYEPSIEVAVKNAGLLAREGADAVKLEGGIEVFDRVREIVKSGIPVMGHIGLTPQRYLTLGGYRTIKDEGRLVEDAMALEEAGVFSIVIENTLAEIAQKITEKVSVPTICIGAGPHCDGQILVIHDLLGLGDISPYFARKYLDLKKEIRDAVEKYVADVKSGSFPSEENYKTRDS
ncbi:3-methyl-2-oxobutanoate hydroxymethyltransferase [Metallosphaera tengchongensis]|uniref:3-methyl-2-oxobutanoate hydroxymethyltransferase n=1 Tax=Metallosphaera tengchongensis TaxID=1532350 RepID=A0A6N0NYV2_9CREN|nr:3-methyl-2-oxobutanoate hydroxymethyltransferase [Metallosphaera tengchongensis]QKR00548.1 3-methyl-2-oxobutanoate hydroxymethyltransferase [Metallosphaera tengchongensis]